MTPATMTDLVPTPGCALHALAAEYNLQLVEDTTSLDQCLRDKSHAHYLALRDGRHLVVVPADQDPDMRVNVVRGLITHLEGDEPPPAEPRHYPWCVPSACISHRYDDGVILTEHIGAELRLSIPAGMRVHRDELLSAQLGSDENLVDERPSVSFNSGGDGVLLNAAEFDSVIDNLADFLDGLRAMRAEMTAPRAEGPA
ncbi:hypothetical protein J7E91_30085 [Streptomyces sp. ISL-99]|uniref:DUF6907 domain-containing protein n=1 Tax=Streptomyces sp. ISL-99 TaxID=2819193 RepID=UPI001BE6CEFF|nr:hypothetical protein [Streptomyces sp. ISL-99]MBT2529530.1 hypothetical protein [Streptomyces sp. ISL-99]